jgi:cation:H+ antiporter
MVSLPNLVLSEARISPLLSRSGVKLKDWSAMLLPLVVFSIGLILLVKGADFMIRGAESLAVKTGVSPTTIGLTVVAFGTSLPELVISTEAFRLGNYAIGTGNVVGSNIANIGLILGLALIVMPTAISGGESRSRLRVNILLTLGAAVVFGVLSLRGYFDVLSGMVFLAIFSGMIFLMWRSGPGEETPSDSQTRHPILLTVAGLAMVLVGADLLLKGALEIAGILSLPPAVIGLSMVAIGTSLPELATLVVAAIKKSPGIAVGNILGSSIFNLLFIIGINSLFFTIPVPDLKDTLVMIGFTLAIFPALFIRRERITRVWGGLLVVAYTLYIALLFGIFWI